MGKEANWEHGATYYGNSDTGGSSGVSFEGRWSCLIKCHCRSDVTQHATSRPLFIYSDRSVPLMVTPYLETSFKSNAKVPCLIGSRYGATKHRVALPLLKMRFHWRRIRKYSKRGTLHCIERFP